MAAVLFTGHVACRLTSVDCVFFLFFSFFFLAVPACHSGCYCSSAVEGQDGKRGGKKPQTTFMNICDCVQGVFVLENSGGNWSTPKWTPWLLGRMLLPAERDLGQRRGEVVWPEAGRLRG